MSHKKGAKLRQFNQLMQKVLEHSDIDSVQETIREALKDDDFWEKPVDFKEFIENPEYLGVKDDIYQGIIDLGNIIFNDDYSEVVMLVGIGAGKSTLAQLIACYVAYYLLCLKNPHKYFNLAADKPIVILNMGLTSTQARRVIFAGIRNFMQNSKWFQRWTLYKKSTIRKEEKMQLFATIIKFGDIIHLMCGSSSETAPLGLNIFCGILDEAAFYLDTDKKNAAEEIYQGIKQRIVSRFGLKGMVVVVSSARYIEDFISKKLEESKSNNNVLGVRGATWELKDRNKMSKETFIFSIRTMRVIPIEECFELKINPTPSQKYKLKYGDDRDKKYWIIPLDFKESFLRNPEKASRDFGSKPSESIEAFFKLKDRISQMWNNLMHPIDEYGRIGLMPHNYPCYIHLDLALGKEGGDCAGLAMCHCYHINSEGKPLIRFDLLNRIYAKPNSEIEFSEIREFIFDLQKLGFSIVGVSMDSYQSFDTKQQLQKAGIQTEIISVDTSLEPYECLKEAIYDGRISCYRYEQKEKSWSLEKELLNLELIKSKKVDHPPKGSKDIADCMAGSVFNLTKNNSNMMTVTFTKA